MASEELQQNYPKAVGLPVGRFELFQTQLATLNQYAAHGIIPDVPFGTLGTQKPDAIVIERAPSLRVIAMAEAKAPGGVTSGNWKKFAKGLLDKKLRPTAALLGYVTDGTTTHWIAGGTDTVTELVHEDGHALPSTIDFSDTTFLAEFEYIVANLDPTTGKIRAPKNLNPEALAREVWQTVWRLQADRPEDCLATFVEIFIYKFLDDLALMTTSATGVNVGFKHLVTAVPVPQSFKYYEANVRPHIKAMFPAGPDGISVINGIVMQAGNRDHNLIFHEILRKFAAFGSLRNTSPEFKSRLYESFLQESHATSTFGQHFTPRTVVGAIYDMAELEAETAGKSICDPAAGVGGFILEGMARNLEAQWTCTGDKIAPMHDWHAMEVVAKTAILAKANALVHCGELLAAHPGRLPDFAKWLNTVFCWKGTTALGSLEDMSKAVYDRIITNPPFVVSGSADVAKLIRSDNQRKSYFSRKGTGLEALFIQFIIQALKPNGHAWVLLPETFFLRTTDAELRNWMLSTCRIDLMAALPERTFFNTSKRVVIVHMVKRPVALAKAAAEQALQSERVLLFAVSEIGETRDAKRLPERSDLPELVNTYRLHRAGALPNKARAVAIPASSLFGLDSINIRHHWPADVARQLGLLGAEEDPLETRRVIDAQVKAMGALIEQWGKGAAKLVPPPVPTSVQTLRMAEFEVNGKVMPNQPYFTLRIGRRVLKKEVHKVTSGVKLYSANVRKPFGFVKAANAGNLEHGGALWSIDSDFDCRHVSPGDAYSITDHCGEVAILTDDIDPAYLAAQIRQAGLDNGFNREFRPSLELMRRLEIVLPVKATGEFDRQLMEAWSAYREKMELFQDEMSKVLSLT